MDFEEDFFSEEEELLFEDSEERSFLEELAEMLEKSGMKPYLNEEENRHQFPFTFEEVTLRVEQCEVFFQEKFKDQYIWTQQKEILPQDAPFLSPQEYGLLVDFLRKGLARVDFNRPPVDYMAGFFLYQDAFPELELNLPPKRKYPLYHSTPKYFSPPDSSEHELGMKYYDLSEIAFKCNDYIQFFSCAMTSAYYGYPLGKELLERVLIGIRLKNLVEETTPVVTSKRSILLAGHGYLTGIGSICNEEQAYLMYKNLAITKNSSKGKLALAMCFLDGIWSDPDQEVAVNLLKDAVEQGNQIAIYQLILTYIMDETTPSLLEEAVKLCKHPKIEGQHLSSFLLGLFYTYGVGVEADLDRGLYFSQQAGDYEIQSLGSRLRARIMTLLEE